MSWNMDERGKTENSGHTKAKNIYWWDPPPIGTSTPVDFCLDSSLHGLKYITQPRRHLAERIFWAIAFLMAVSLATYFIMLIWTQYQRSPIIVSFQPTETSIDRIPFPAITICNVNNVRRNIAEDYIKKARKLMEEYAIDQQAFANLYYLDHVCEINKFTKNFNFKQELDVDFLLFQYVLAHLNASSLTSITEFLGNVAQSCEDMIPLCYWGDEVQNCSHLFFPSETNYGYCCTFNMVTCNLDYKCKEAFFENPLLTSKHTNDSHDNAEVYNEWESLKLTSENIILKSENELEMNSSRHKWPKRQLRAGKSSGLTVLLNPDLDNYYCTNTDSAGFQLEAHSPLSFPKPNENGIAVTPFSETFMAIKPDITVADDNILTFPLSKRQCYFTNEMQLLYYKFYTSSNCVDECIANITYETCKCVRYYMPRGNIRALCGPLLFSCTEGVRKDVLNKGIRRTCKMCLPLCTQIQYTIDSTTMPLRKDVNLWIYENGTEALWAGKNVTILHLYYGVDSTYPRVLNQLYGATDLVSNTGGILGLCLGFSGLSALEIIYFLTIRAWFRSRRGKKINEKISAVATNAWRRFSPKIQNPVSHDTEDIKKPKNHGRGNSNSFATSGEFRTWVVGPATNSVGLSLEISPMYRAPPWAQMQ